MDFNEKLEYMKQNAIKKILQGKIKDREEMPSDYRYEKIRDYIHENYKNPMLNVNMIADVFNVNRSWLSKRFREKNGINISEYIVKYRLEEAKELLKTDMTISQIAAETGFSGEIVYCRAFKKYEGITSMQYRQRIQATGKKENNNS